MGEQSVLKLLTDLDEMSIYPTDHRSKNHDPTTPTWSCAGVDLYLCDGVEMMKRKDAKSIDAVITDPPYGNGTPYGDEESGYGDTRDNLRSLITCFLPQAHRIATNIIITPGVGNLWLYPEPEWTMCWTEPSGCGSGPWGFCCWQPILAYGKDPYMSAGLGRRPDTYVGHGQPASDPRHPCAKPLDFMDWLMVRATIKEGQLVCDPFMGIGTTGVAAIKRRRRFIGAEINASYFDVAVERCEQALKEVMNH